MSSRSCRLTNMLDPSQTYRFEVVLLRPEELDILTDRINSLETQIVQLRTERDRYQRAMSEVASLKNRLSFARRLIKRLGEDPDKYHL